MYSSRAKTKKLREMDRWYSISIKISIITNIIPYGICSDYRYLSPSGGQCRQHWWQFCQKLKYLWADRFGVFLFLNENLGHSLQNIVQKHLIHQDSDKIKQALDNQTVPEYWQQNETIPNKPELLSLNVFKIYYGA